MSSDLTALKPCVDNCTRTISPLGMLYPTAAWLQKATFLSHPSSQQLMPFAHRKGVAVCHHARTTHGNNEPQYRRPRPVGES